MSPAVMFLRIRSDAVHASAAREMYLSHTCFVNHILFQFVATLSVAARHSVVTKQG